MGKIAVIAGVGPGLGAALARKFVQEGCDVALLSRSSAYIKNLSTRLAESGRKAIPIPTDVAEAEEVAASFARIREELGDPDILVNHAGNAAWGSFADLTPEAFEGAWRRLHARWISLFKTGCTGDATERWREYTLHGCNVCCPW